MIVAGLILSGGLASAAAPVPPTVRTDAITSSTNIGVLGTVQQTESITWVQASTPFHDPPLVNGGWPFVWVDAHGNLVFGWTVDPLVIAVFGPAPDGELRYAAGYTAGTTAVQGDIHVTNSVDLDNADQTGDKGNIQTTSLLTFAALDEAGQAVGSEDILVDGIGSQRLTGDNFFNPFASSSGPFLPPFANTVQSGSSYNILLGTVDTAASERFIATIADVPVAQGYSITGRGRTLPGGTVPAVGMMNAFMNAHLQEGLEENITPTNPAAILQPIGYSPGLAGDITYGQSVSASGTINTFGQSYHYEDGSHGF